MNLDIFDLLSDALEKNLDLDIYYQDLAPEKPDCPYITLAYSNETPNFYKGASTGDVLIIIDIWHDRIDKRKELMKIISKIAKLCDELNIEDHTVFLKSFNSRVMVDTTTNTPYLHGSISVVFFYT